MSIHELNRELQNIPQDQIKNYRIKKGKDGVYHLEEKSILTTLFRKIHPSGSYVSVATLSRDMVSKGKTPDYRFISLLQKLTPLCKNAVDIAQLHEVKQMIEGVVRKREEILTKLSDLLKDNKNVNEVLKFIEDNKVAFPLCTGHAIDIKLEVWIKNHPSDADKLFNKLREFDKGSTTELQKMVMIKQCEWIKNLAGEGETPATKLHRIDKAQVNRELPEIKKIIEELQLQRKKEINSCLDKIFNLATDAGKDPFSPSMADLGGCIVELRKLAGGRLLSDLLTKSQYTKLDKIERMVEKKFLTPGVVKNKVPLDGMKPKQHPDSNYRDTAAGALFTKWNTYFPDLVAASQTLTRGGELSSSVTFTINGKEVSLESSLKGLPGGIDGEQKKQYIVMKMADTFLEELKKAYPKTGEEKLKKMVGEAFTLSAAELNPAGNVPFNAYNAFSEPYVYHHDKGYPIREFSFSQKDTAVVCSLTMTNRGQAFAANDIEKTTPTMQYTSVLTKTGDKEWSGTVTIERLEEDKK